MKTTQFEVLTRSKTLTYYTDSLELITEKALGLLKHELDQDLELPALRLMGKISEEIDRLFSVHC